MQTAVSNLIKKLVPLSGIVETSRLQAEKSSRCREATCHSGPRAGIQERGNRGILDAGLRRELSRTIKSGMTVGTSLALKSVDCNQPISEPLVL